MATHVTPFLMFQDGNAEAAMRFYVSLFRGAEVLEAVRYGAGQPGPEGTLKHGVFVIAGQKIRCLDSHVKHAFGFTPASSLFVDCESEEEVNELAAKLGEGGGALMPPGAYGFSRRFAWVNDRYGVSWQLNCA